jgi:HK97 family phage major capsid protein
MQEAMKAYGGLINLANVITTSTGNTLQWPTNDDTANKGAILAENTQISETDLTFGTRAIGAHTYTSKLVRVSLQLLQDSAFDLNAWLPRKLGERIGRAIAEDLISGTGVAEPTGLLPNATASGVTSTAASWTTRNAGNDALVFDALIDLEHSIDPAYRTNTRFLVSDKVLSTLRKVKDADNRPLWLPVPTPGMPATINGQPYAIDQGMPAKSTWASADRPVLYGNFREGYLVRQVLDVQQVRLAERYADYLQVGFFGFMRMDAMPDDANAVKALVLS